jgi:hypothetical protein
MSTAVPPSQSLPLGNYYWALPERLLAGEHPAGATPEATRARLQSLLESGISCFLDLTQEHEQSSYAASLPASVQYLRRPLPDHGIPERPEAMAEILDCLHAALGRGQRVYLHCRAR